MIQINFQNFTSYKTKEYEEKYHNIAKYTLNKFGFKGNVELSVTFVSKNKIKEINNLYRHIDRVTDVISFENDEGFESYDGFITLGDLFICVNKAKMQAKNYGHSFEREMCFLFTHGLLHLLKMDHIKKEDEIKMIAMQNEIMDHFKIYR